MVRSVALTLWRGLARVKVPLRVQVGAVASLFVAALVLLWSTWASVVERERRRVEAKALLERAGKALTDRGSPVLAGAPGDSFFFVEPRDWDALQERLEAEARQALAPFQGV
jgi:hypothetical protein